MSISLGNREGAWYDAAPRQGGVYDLATTALSGRTRDERLQAVTALGKSEDPRAVRPLMDLLGENDTEIRLQAIISLGLLKSGRPVDDLIGRLRDRDEQMAIREQAAIALSSIRSTGALRGLREFAADASEDAALRTRTETLLKNIPVF